MSARVTFKAIKAPERQIASARAIAEIEAAAYDWGNRMVEKLRRYPPVPAGSTYVRTKALKEGWRWRRSYAGGALSVVVINDTAKYASFVQGRKQRSYHASHGWRTAEELSKELEREVPFHRIVSKIFAKYVGV